MKKVLIGCGVLVFAGIVAVVALGVWVKHKAAGFTAAIAELQAQNQQLQKLDAQYPFSEPPAGQPLAITESRLKDYLAIRAELMPVYQDFQAKGEAFKKAHPDNHKADFSGALEATGLMSQLLTQVRSKVIEGLETHHMSPREFRQLTTAIYEMPNGPNQALLDRYKAQLEQYKEGVGLDVLATSDDARPNVPR